MRFCLAQATVQTQADELSVIRDRFVLVALRLKMLACLWSVLLLCINEDITERHALASMWLVLLQAAKRNASNTAQHPRSGVNCATACLQDHALDARERARTGLNQVVAGWRDVRVQRHY